VVQECGWLGSVVGERRDFRPERSRVWRSQPAAFRVARWGVAVWAAKNWFPSRSGPRQPIYSPWWCLRQLSLPSVRVGKGGPALAGKANAWFNPFVEKRVSGRWNCVILENARRTWAPLWWGWPIKRRYIKCHLPFTSIQMDGQTELRRQLRRALA